MTTNEIVKVKEYLAEQKGDNKKSLKNFNNLKRWLQIQETTATFNNASPALVATLIDLCFRHNLNPIQNDVYLLPLKYGQPPQIFIAYDVLYRMALNTGKIDYWDVHEVWAKDDETKLLRVDITVKRTDMKQPTTLSYLMNEWKKETKSNDSPWAKMPAFMLRKCAIARTFSLVFQDIFSEINYYTEAEAWTKEQDEAIKYQQDEIKKIKSEIVDAE